MSGTSSDHAGTPPAALGRSVEGLTREEAEKHGNRERRQASWEALRALWDWSSRPRTRKCRRIPTADLVAIEKRQWRANLTGLQTCGWDGCPCCGPKIAAERAADIAAAISAHYMAGGSVLFLTLTLRHSAGQRLSTLLDAASSAWTAINDDKTTQARRKALSIGYIKSNDLTVGRNGWHPHPHVLVFLRPGVSEADALALGHGMFKPWARRLVRLGLAAPTEKHGVDAKVLNLSQAQEAVAGYVTASEYAAARPALSAALEVANGNAKMARRGNRTPMQLLADCVATGKPADRRLWAEYETATQKRHRIRWSDGLRALLIPELGEALTDEEAAASDDGMGRLLAYLDRDTWRRVRDRHHGPAHLLTAAESHDDDDQARAVVHLWLAGHNLGTLIAPGDATQHRTVDLAADEPPPCKPEPRSTAPAGVPASILAFLDTKATP